MNSNKSYYTAFIGVMAALTFVVLFLETYVFTVLIPLAPPCFLSLSLAITISLSGDWKFMFIGGTVLGFCSFIIAFIIGNPVFIFPWISILPRVMIGVVAFGVSKLMLSLTKNAKRKFAKQYLSYGVSAVFGVITNTVLVLSVMYLGKFIGLEDVVATFMAINFPIEIVASAILVPIMLNAVKRFKKGA